MENALRNEAETLAVKWGIPLVIALLAVGVRMMLNAKPVTLVSLARGVIVGVFVGALVNIGLMDIESIGPGTRGAIIGASVILAEDALSALLTLFRYARKHPDSVLEAIIRWRR